MRRKSHVFVTCLFAILIGTLQSFPVPALAQSGAAAIEQAKAEAKRAADRAQNLFKEGQYDEAIGAFREADQKFHAPTFLLMIARAHEKQGRLREARDAYRVVVNEKLTNYAPKVFFDAQDEAKRELEALLPRIPTVRVTVTGAHPQEVMLLIDEQPATVEVELELNPGEHTIAASAPARKLVTQKFSLQDGMKRLIVLDLPPPPPPPAAAPPAKATPIAPAPVASASTNIRWPVIAAFSVAGAIAGVGAITGALSLGTAGSLKERCNNLRCYDDRGGSVYDRAYTLGTVSTVSFVVGGLAAGVGVALLVWPGGGDQERTEVMLGPGWLGVHGRF